MAENDVRAYDFEWFITEEMARQANDERKDLRSDLYEVLCGKGCKSKEKVFLTVSLHPSLIEDYAKLVLRRSHVGGLRVTGRWYWRDDPFRVYFSFDRSRHFIVYYRTNGLFPIQPGAMRFRLEITSDNCCCSPDFLQLESDLGRLLLSGSMSDVTLVCAGEEFPCHKLVLSCRCAAFEAMFRPGNGFTEGEEECRRVVIEEADPKALKVFLDYLYGGRVDYNQDMELTLSVMELADRYGVVALKDKCSEAVMRSLDADNYWTCLRRTPRLNGSPKLLQHAVRMAMERPEDLLDNAEWLQLVRVCPELTVALMVVVKERLKENR